MKTFLLAAFISLGVAPPAALAQLPVTVESLDLHFRTPKGWRLLPESTPTQLVLAPGKEKQSPLMRVALFRGQSTVERRLAEMKRGLPGEESLVEAQETVAWSEGGLELETLRALYKKGSQEWWAELTLVDSGEGLQHAFWLFGRKQDLKRHRKVVRASIRSALHDASNPKRDAGGSKSGESASEKSTATEPVPANWSDAKSGLQIARWPAGFAPVQASLSKLSTTGIVLTPSSPSAPKSAEMRLSRRAVGDLVTPDSTADTLEERLKASGVKRVQRKSGTVAGVKSVHLDWTQSVRGVEQRYEVWLWKAGTSLYRLDSSAPAEWSRDKARRDAAKEFLAGLSFS